MPWRNLIPSLLLGLLIHGTSLSQTGVDALRGTSDAAQGVFDRISGTAAPFDTPASFPGGDEKMYRFIRKNLTWPAGVPKSGMNGRVYVEFEVMEDGTLDNVKVEQGLGPAFDREAVRVVTSMPRWIPAQRDGGPIASRMTIPIVFDHH